jgi:hypothetical protein
VSLDWHNTIISAHFSSFQIFNHIIALIYINSELIPYFEFCGLNAKLYCDEPVISDSIGLANISAKA